MVESCLSNVGVEKLSAAKEGTTTLSTKVYLKALPLRDLEAVNIIKREVESGSIIITRVIFLAERDINKIKGAVNESKKVTQLVGGDIAKRRGKNNHNSSLD